MSSSPQAASAHDLHGTRRSDSDDKPLHRRLFIGPMPEKVLSQTAALIRKKNKRVWFQRAGASPNNGEDCHDGLSAIIQEHAYQFFLNQGGNEAGWGENEEENVQQEMLRRWRDSEWGSIWKRRMQKSHEHTSRWVGGSFEIGNFLGLNILDDAHARNPRLAAPSRTDSSIEQGSSLGFSSSSRPNTSIGRTQLAVQTSTTSQNASTTRPSEIRPFNLPKAGPFISAASAPGPSPYFPPENAHDADSHRPFSYLSTTPLLIPDADQSSTSKIMRSDVVQRPLTTIPGRSDRELHEDSSSTSRRPALTLQKRKTVHYIDSPSEPPPAPPTEVLARSGSAIQESSAEATEAIATHDDISRGDVVMRDRMLVRVSYTRSEGLGNSFDERQNRITSHMRYEDSAEFMVVWRQSRIEIYENYILPGKEWVVGHKHLAFIIPLNLKTKLSLYSFVDLTFCLTCPPTPVRSSASKARAIFHRSTEGTNVFVFKLKSRTRALDWMWQLWRQLGGELPSSIEIHCPAMDSRVKIDMPGTISLDTNEDTAMFTRANIITLCRQALQKYHDWEIIIERELEMGKHLELAWRMETMLDWIWLNDDLEGNRRNRAVLCGLALKQSGKSFNLEIRPGQHQLSIIHLQDGKKLHEPPAIEGYLDRIKPSTQIKKKVYLTTHDGNILALNPTQAQPPLPPGAYSAMSDTGDITLHHSEVKRGTRQVMQATGVCDLRSILTVRRSFHLVPQHLHSVEDIKGGQKDSRAQSDNDEWTDSDNEDEGGDEGLAKSSDKPKLKMQRSFELLLKTGRVIRFEAHSRRFAIEWIERLRDLIIYWKHRHRVDARVEMDLAQVGNYRSRITPLLHTHSDEHELPPEAPADMDASLPALSSLYNWCVLDGCKAVLKSGKLYTRKGLHGYYKLVQLFLTSGHLIQYHVTPHSALHHRESHKINLLDAYVTSGYFAALALPKGQFSPCDPSVPRRYQDGLEADDPDEDMLFMIWYRHRAPVIDELTANVTTVGGGADPGAQDIPGLSAKRKLMVFRTRSKLDRDAWCWAINCQIEKLVRASKEREEKLREMSGLISL